ncbi:3-phosphoserine/phosphohydroxythreonine transaminase [Glaciecola petra]|uniref:Phosphoserine aminotransferase n=1 Tax=Glaciecola petra TaxID=3075602 RepID=A0ABU2ZNS9_9ALTE|nr:3-phosphoserine/phosphohydroxythreonine transaminase [Aestuariibacter sp. P117]MDT0594286.1 3-phosphoserine/phosphohydroxythreonine transaminase [Aestuariibacter sp. P117]
MTIYNFCAGPAMLPKAVLEKAKTEMLNWNGSGTSVMEVSHRGAPFMSLARESEQNLRHLLAIPNNYKVLFMHGGGRGNFFSVPLNLSKRGTIAQFLNSGMWSDSAIKEAQKYLQVEVVASNIKRNNLIEVPEQTEWEFNSDAAYFHYCSNETVDGIEINWVPQTGDVPLVADMSSNILSKPLDIEKFGIIYAGAQKNIGPSGLSIVIIRDDLLDFQDDKTPSVFSFKEQVKHDSMYNTPPTFSWYLAGLVFEWLIAQGGLENMEKLNKQKSQHLYSCIDGSQFYKNNVHPNNRSRMNVTFDLADERLNDAFLKQANESGLLALKGHRAVGGMRASIYNAMPMEGVEALCSFMRDFERVNA